MSRAVQLLPNLAGEETDPSAAGQTARRALPAPARALAHLWAGLFGSPPPEWLGDPPELDSPHGAGDAPADAAFDWLPAAADGPVAWYGGRAAAAHPALAGAALAGPTAEVVERVHDKAFALRVAREHRLQPAPFDEAVAIFEADDLRDGAHAMQAVRRAVSRWPEAARETAVLKPRQGSSGRGRVEVGGARLERNLPGAIDRLVRRGGAVLEPWVERNEDLSVALHVDANGALQLLGSLRPLISPAGLPLGHRGELDSRGRVFSGSRWDDEMRAAAAGVAISAGELGFHGACATDGFSFSEAGRERLRPLCEFNARFTSGVVVLGLLRRARPQVRAALGVEPGERAGFCFGLAEPPAGWQTLAASLPETPLLLEPLGRGAGPGLIVTREPTAIDAVAAAVLDRSSR